MYRPLPDCVTIKDSLIDGLGLFATKDIPKGTYLGISHIYVDNNAHQFCLCQAHCDSGYNYTGN